MINATQKRILEIVLDERSVSDEVLAPQVRAGGTAEDVAA